MQGYFLRRHLCSTLRLVPGSQPHTCAIRQHLRAWVWGSSQCPFLGVLEKTVAALRHRRCLVEAVNSLLLQVSSQGGFKFRSHQIHILFKGWGG